MTASEWKASYRPFMSEFPSPRGIADGPSCWVMHAMRCHHIRDKVLRWRLKTPSCWRGQWQSIGTI